MKIRAATQKVRRRIRTSGFRPATGTDLLVTQLPARVAIFQRLTNVKSYSKILSDTKHVCQTPDTKSAFTTVSGGFLPVSRASQWLTLKDLIDFTAFMPKHSLTPSQFTTVHSLSIHYFFNIKMWERDGSIDQSTRDELAPWRAFHFRKHRNRTSRRLIDRTPMGSDIKSRRKLETLGSPYFRSRTSHPPEEHTERRKRARSPGPR